MRYRKKTSAFSKQMSKDKMFEITDVAANLSSNVAISCKHANQQDAALTAERAVVVDVNFW